MVKKIIIFFLFYILINLYGQDITIFFLKDGSILQGKIVNENQYRIFLKTDQGTIKIIPSDVLGREDAANKGDLTFFAERLEQLQQNVRYLTGKVNHMKDSLSISLEGVNDLYLNIEAIQNEFEIELLRLQSKAREHNQSLEYNKDDLINNRVRIAENSQQLGGISDTVRTLDIAVKKINEKLQSNMDKSFLLSGNLATIKKDIQTIKTTQDNSQNQIDMMSGALANNIQEVIRVQGKFSDVESGVKNNLNSIDDLSRALIIQKDDFTILLNSKYNAISEELVIIKDAINTLKLNISSLDEKSEQERGAVLLKVGDLKSELEILNEKVISYNRENKLTKEKLLLLDENVSSINKNLIKMENFVKSLDKEITEIESKIDAASVTND